MKRTLSVLGALGAGLAMLAAAGTAHARSDVYWSLGVEAAPGVTLGVGNARPVVVAPAPIYVAPPPVYVAPRPVYVAPPPVVMVPQPAYYAAAPVYYGAPVYGHPGGKWKKHKHWKHHH